MHDIKAIRENPAAFDAGWKLRGLEKQTDAILALDAASREAATQKQQAEAARNAASKQIGAVKAQKNEAEAQRLMAEVANLKATIESAGAREAEVGKQLHDLLAGLPNIPAPGVPEGLDEADNKEVRRWGEPREIKDAKDHVAIGEALGLMDFEGAARMSGSRFVALKGGLARMERALASFMLDLHTAPINHAWPQLGGYTEVSPPLLVRDAAMFGTGQMPKFENDQFFASSFVNWSSIDPIQQSEIGAPWMVRDFDPDLLKAVALELAAISDEDEERSYREEGRGSLRMRAFIGALEAKKIARRSWLIPTAEVSLANLAREQIHEEGALPIRMTADTPCFRSEAGAAGRDTRGMIRMHQFRKVELVSITAPEQSEVEHERMTACAEEVLQRL